MKRSFFTGQKITVMGLGLHGGGVAVVKWLVKHGASVTVTDLKNKEELRSSIKSIKKYLDKLGTTENIKYVLGRHREADFKNTDLVIQNPGVPRDSKYLKIAQGSGVPIENDASLFLKYCPGKIIGVTGTRGKSTTASLIYSLLKEKSSGHAEIGSASYATSKTLKQVQGDRVDRVWLAGLPGRPMMEILDKIKENDLVILELSSWQLEILGAQKLSPELAVVTNIYPDHLNRYASFNQYAQAKRNIFRYQRPTDVSVFHYDHPVIKSFGRQTPSKRLWFSKKFFAEQNAVFLKDKAFFFRFGGRLKKLASLDDVALSGEHNLDNVLAALAVAGYFRVVPQAISRALRQFQGLPGRLAVVRHFKGVTYINDTTATTPDATMAALQTLSSELRAPSSKQVVLIAGGASKNIPQKKYNELAQEIKKNCRAVLLFDGEGSDSLLRALKKKKFSKVVCGVLNMSDALGLANNFAKKGDTVLLSPACASFGLFINEFDRGEQFEKIVDELK